jgi:hypothetical protein
MPAQIVSEPFIRHGLQKKIFITQDSLNLLNAFPMLLIMSDAIIDS